MPFLPSVMPAPLSLPSNENPLTHQNPVPLLLGQTRAFPWCSYPHGISALPSLEFGTTSHFHSPLRMVYCLVVSQSVTLSSIPLCADSRHTVFGGRWLIEDSRIQLKWTFCHLCPTNKILQRVNWKISPDISLGKVPLAFVILTKYKHFITSC